MADHDDRGESRAGMPSPVSADEFEALYRRHVEGVHRLACRLAGAGEAEAIAQDVFVQAWRKMATFRGESRLETWLHRLTVNSFISRRRAEGIRPRGEEGLAREAVSEAGDLRLDLERGIGRLPPRARAVFVLHDVEGHSHQETARILDVSVGTSKSQLHRARALLCEFLEGSDG